MKAMIFAAGLGTRLMPITADKPKALAPFGSQTLLEYNLKFLAAQGVDYFVINIHHFSNKVVHYLMENNNFGLNLDLSYEPELLDTAGGIAKALHLFDKSSPILLYNVDIISNINLERFYNHHIQSQAAATLAVRQRETQRYLLFNEENRLAGWQDVAKGEQKWVDEPLLNVANFAFSGIHLVNYELLKRISISKISLTEFYLEQAKNHIISSYEHNEDYWFDCGKIETLSQAEKLVLGL
jgi:NDP-sugar pyrophosphorylase family protein